VPGDKSLSHRALILAAMAAGRSEITGLGPGADVAATRRAVGDLGIHWDADAVVSPGVSRWSAPHGPVDCGNSGTAMRLLAGALAASPFTTILTGDESLTTRPMERVAEPLRRLGATVVTTSAAPLEVTGGALTGTAVELGIPSAQVRSAFELGALQAAGPSQIDSPPGYRDHTERLLASFGLGTRLTQTRFEVLPGQVPAARYEIPGDPSSASFLWAAAALVPEARVTTPRISLNPGRLGFLEILGTMGAIVEGEVTEAFHGDPVGTISVTGAALLAIDVAGELVAAAIDELPLVAVLGAYAEGITTVRDARELRTKESDRIATTVHMIRDLGGGAEERDDGFTVVGTGFLETGTVDPRGDHRIAMAAAVAATRSYGPVQIAGSEVVDVSWPGFYETLEDAWS